MTSREAKRLAILVAVSELSGSLDISDEWLRHPENDVAFNRDEALKVKEQGRHLVVAMASRARRFE